ncbi:MAG: GTPase Era [Acetobacter sp.]|nr:GTPase Era [Acetobacter sp.]MBO6043987.1 GTPase Era [Acetobacter sp.]MBO6091888.1 GTPase Era [Acetobacter sp.]MBO7350513.1 GTPase Era [Acetobacter sp.]MBQ5478597.1 GTPase Era [Acetobacter sp.]
MIQDASKMTRCGFVTLVGTPNAGKSTLLNKLVGAKISIVSPKAQTTRFRTLGILIRKSSQILLVDTPGIFQPRRMFDKAMMAATWEGTEDADIVLLLVDVKFGLTSLLEGIIERLKNSDRKVWLVLNKIDLISRDILLRLTASLIEKMRFERVFMISALTGSGIEDLLDQLADHLPEGPYLYPEDDLTDLPERLFAAELVREQIFIQSHEEVPYSVTVETESYKELCNGSIRVDVVIYVLRPGHKAILIGHRGQKLRRIGENARKQLSHLLGRPCHLFLNVKERSGWDRERERLRAIGLDVVRS